MREAAPEVGAHVRLSNGRHATGAVRLRTPSVKVVLFALVLAVLGGLVGLAVSREVAPATQDAASARLALPTPRPARASAEQSYLEALWPIHTSVERVVVRVALGASFYKLEDHRYSPTSGAPNIDRNHPSLDVEDLDETWQARGAAPGRGRTPGCHARPGGSFSPEYRRQWAQPGSPAGAHDRLRES